MFLRMSAMQILIASHDDARALTLAQGLRAAGLTVEVIGGDSAGAAEALRAGADALLVDLRWPGLDPSRVVRALYPSGDLPPESLEETERRQILLALRHTGGNKRHAALLLGIARSTLIQKVRRYGLESGPVPVRAESPHGGDEPRGDAPGGQRQESD
jgi:DNA-binding NtrC family response regulator